MICVPVAGRLRLLVSRRVATLAATLATLSPLLSLLVACNQTNRTTLCQSGDYYQQLEPAAMSPLDNIDNNNNDTFASQYYAIQVVDDETGRGVPLAYLRTTYKTVYTTDSAGYVAFHEPGLMTGDALWVAVRSYGYEAPRGFLGAAGVQVHPTPGGSVVIRLRRTQPAERLYRMTGYGIYRDSVLLGRPVPLARPVLNARVAGSDTVQCARLGGRLLWMWQDTDRLSFPLGNFRMTGATTDLPGRGLDPDRGLDFRYLTVDGRPDEFARELAQIPLDTEGSFPLWVDGLTVVPDDDDGGRERLVGRYYAAGPDMGCVEEGLTLWDDGRQVLEKLARLPAPGAPAPSGHTVYAEDAATGVRYAFYARNVRVRADLASAGDPARYEALTCLTADGARAVRGPDGAPAWRWVAGGAAVHHDNADELVRRGVLRAGEAPWRLRDAATGRAVSAAHASVAWSARLGLWAAVVQQRLGATTAGEVWLATARSPAGPWAHCVQVATHRLADDDDDAFRGGNPNDLYNPVLHHELARADDGGRFLYFSGTLANTFSGNPWPTPYYSYNNLMYRLDLDDPRLRLPPPPPGLWDVRPSD